MGPVGQRRGTGRPRDRPPLGPAAWGARGGRSRGQHSQAGRRGWQAEELAAWGPQPEGAFGRAYSTVTLLARLRGWSTSRPLAAASSMPKMCSGTTARSGSNSGAARGMCRPRRRTADRRVTLFGDRYDPRATSPNLLDVGHDLGVQRARVARRRHDDHDLSGLDQRDRAVLELTGREALGVDIGELFELKRPLEGDRVADVAAEEEDRAGVGHPAASVLIRSPVSRTRVSPGRFEVVDLLGDLGGGQRAAEVARCSPRRNRRSLGDERLG